MRVYTYLYCVCIYTVYLHRHVFDVAPNRFSAWKVFAFKEIQEAIEFSKSSSRVANSGWDLPENAFRVIEKFDVLEVCQSKSFE